MPTKKGYKVFYLKDGKLYPPMVANPQGAGTPLGKWIKAHDAKIVDKVEVDRKYKDVPKWLRHYHVAAGGTGTRAAKQKLAYRPGWHLGELPYATQFHTKANEWPEELVWAVCEYHADAAKHKQYQYENDMRMLTDRNGNPVKNGKPIPSNGGINHIPVGSYYLYKTNIKKDSVVWAIAGEMKVNRILSEAQVSRILKSKGITPPPIRRCSTRKQKKSKNE